MNLARWAPWWPLLKLALIAGGLAIAWLHGCSWGSGREEQKAAAALSEARQQRIQHYEEQLATAHAAAMLSRMATDALAGRLDRLNISYTTLRTAIERAPLVVREVDRETNCPDPRLAATVRVCRNAAATGSTDATADCAALGVSTSPAP